MAYDLQEQEQIAALKAWWEKYGTFVLTIVTLLLVAAAAYNGWRWYEQRQAHAAGLLYEQMLRAQAEKDTAKAREVAGTLLEKHGRTLYAALAALQAARLYHDAGDWKAAAAQLRWVIDKSGRPELVATARVRLAGVLLDAQQYEEALAALAGEVPPSHAVQFADRRGDILVAQGKVEQARAAYEQALREAREDHPLRLLIQFKLDALPAAS
ncbi:MAG: tetratricopeptide repeat protein [Sutterellaceae bacterium]|nr:tetratricopeptide repeat protein [Burkholderiaceae bacterium]MCX7901556.1 tetratricopeptide repeat protein [Burkholderiaceae bacterium]MDW8429063.1 tetratricopeptide repeat protein [Sutterellaceae bacterium]